MRATVAGLGTSDEIARAFRARDRAKLRALPSAVVTTTAGTALMPSPQPLPPDVKATWTRSRRLTVWTLGAPSVAPVGEERSIVNVSTPSSRPSSGPTGTTTFWLEPLAEPAGKVSVPAVCV